MEKKKILIVEDDDILREIYIDILNGEGFQTVSAKNGLEALDVLASGENSLALLLTDFLMPVMNGGQLIDQLMKNGQLNFPVLMITASIHSVKINGQDITVISKPSSVDEILDKVRQKMA